MTKRISLDKVSGFIQSSNSKSVIKGDFNKDELSALFSRGSYSDYHPDLQGYLPSKQKLLDLVSSAFPVINDLQTAQVTIKDIVIKKPILSYERSREKQLSYAVAIYGVFNLVLFSVDELSGARSVDVIKTQESYLFDLPIMTAGGNFLVNGVERIIISQIHRSPGVIFNSTLDNLNQHFYSARIIPYQGSWLDFEIEPSENVVCRINKKRKFSIVNILSLFDISQSEIADVFFGTLEVKYRKELGLFEIANPKKFIEIAAEINIWFNLVNKEGDLILKSFSAINQGILRKNPQLYIEVESLINHGLLSNFEGKESGFVIDEEFINKLKSSNKADSEFKVTFIGVAKSVLFNTLFSNSYAREASLRAFFKTIRPGSQFSVDDAERLFEYTFKLKTSYNLTEVGRMKLNQVLNLDIPSDMMFVTKEDIVATIRKMVYYKRKLITDLDVDSLSNRRIRLPSELIENSIKSSASKLSRSVLEKLNSMTLENAFISDIVSSINADIREFFLLSTFSQLEDRTNPLSRLAHKRRISSFGPGGVSKSRTTFEVRDVHPTHYGRICPIETPEGQNIGLIMNLALHSKCDRHGFIMSPYRKVVDGKITDEVIYLSPSQEANNYIASINQRDFKDGKIISPIVTARYNGEIVQVAAKNVSYIDYNPNQLLSLGASLIPFVENTDAGRAMMGSNMQKQALPLIQPEAPLVGTGTERSVVEGSYDVTRARRKGVVSFISSEKILVEVQTDEGLAVDVYNIFDISANIGGTITPQKPVVKLGQKISVGDVLTEGQSISNSELSLGRNLLVGFMTWNGYNFEDSIILSEKICASGGFDTVHISEHIAFVRDTRIGPEEVTRAIPGANASDLKSLDESGIVLEGTFVQPGDILVGKVSPKVQDLLTPEEKLLKAIFGERGGDKKDSSLTVPAGVQGTVVGVKILTKRGYDKCQRALEIERTELLNLAYERGLKVQMIESYCQELADAVLNEAKADKKTMSETLEKKLATKLEDSKLAKKLNEIKILYKNLIAENKKHYDQSASSIVDGDDLQQGNLAVVKVYIATKRALQPGDKMAGRHGNKGVVSKILPVEDMPFLQDGTPLDIVLSSLGIPSRMNIGQILETHLGLVSKTIAKQIDEMMAKKKANDEIVKMVQDVISSPAFDADVKKMSKDELNDNLQNWAKKGVLFACPSFGGFNPDDITNMYKKLGLDESGQSYLYDGLTGERFERKVTVGYIYMLKLHHIVDEKIHARSVGTYSLVTQQPLGGRANFGGQRFGEMECWALQAYGASYTLQEMLTVKSDDIDGRSKMYESIIKGDVNFSYGMPESFNVLVKELNALGLNLSLEMDSW